MSSVVPSSSLFRPNDIWTMNAQDRPLGNQGADDLSSTTGPNPQTNGWSSASRPWNHENQTRPDNSSPSRQRNVGATQPSSFLDRPAAGGAQNGTGAVGTRPFPDSMSNFASHRLSQPDALANAPLPHFASTSDGNGAFPRPAGSPAFGDSHRSRHTPNNSFHSHSRSIGSGAGLGPQSVTHLSFALNNRYQAQQQGGDDDLSSGLRRMNLDGAASFNPTSQASNASGVSQPWRPEHSAPRLSTGHETNVELIAAQMTAMQRNSIDRDSVPNYHMDSNGGSRAYPPSDAWMGPQPASTRMTDMDRRASQQQLPDYVPTYYGQNPYGNLSSQYPPSYPQTIQNNIRQPMYPGHGFPVQQGYLSGVNLTSLGIPALGMQSADQDATRRSRSRVLEDFRASHKSGKRYELRDIYDHVVEFCGDQHGSRYIQDKLMSANSDEKDVIFREIEPNAVQLMKDVFGNYVIQKFFEHGNQVQKRTLAEKMKGKMLDLSVQVYACRVVQKALEHVLVEQQVELAQELAVDPLRVIRDANGNHVVQKIIQVVPRQQIGFMFDALRGQIHSLAVHAYGCRVVQRMLESGTDQDRTDIMKELDACIDILIPDQYGNYVAQHVIDKGNAADRTKFIDMVFRDVLKHSKHKYASNVVEKCFLKCTPAQHTQIRRLVSSTGPDGIDNLSITCKDQFGNYVIQKLLDELSGKERADFEEDIRGMLVSLFRAGANSRQLHNLAKKVGMESVGSPTRPSTSSSTCRVTNSGSSNQLSSTAPTPVLTNETNTPQSSSPPSVHASADGLSTADVIKDGPFDGVRGSALRVQDTE